MDSYVKRLRVHPQDTLMKVMNVMDTAGWGLVIGGAIAEVCTRALPWRL